MGIRVTVHKVIAIKKKSWNQVLMKAVTELMYIKENCQQAPLF